MLNPTQCAVCPALRIDPLSSLTDDQRQDLERWVAPRRLATHQALFKPGQWPSFVFALREGSLKLVREEVGGTGTVVDMAFPGEWVGLSSLLSGQYFNLLAEALEPSAVCAVRGEDFIRHFNENPVFNRQVVGQMAGALEAAHAMLLLRSHHDAASRLAACLLHLESRRPAEALSGVVITKADLGQMISTAQETVSRLLTKFEKRGLLRRDERRIVLVNLPGLRDMAGQARNT